MKELLFGTAGIPLSAEPRTTIDGIKHVRRLGLGSMELEFVRSVNITKDKSPEVKKAAEENDVVLTCHAPYFINLNSLEKAKIRVKHGSRYGEVLLIGADVFIIHDVDHEEKEISKAKIKEDGSLGTTEKSSLAELEKVLTKVEIPPKVFIKEPIFEDLKNIFGKDVEILVNY